MEKRNIGKSGPSFAAIVYGAMVLEGNYGQSDDARGVATIAEAVDQDRSYDQQVGHALTFRLGQQAIQPDQGLAGAGTTDPAIGPDMGDALLIRLQGYTLGGWKQMQ